MTKRGEKYDWLVGSSPPVIDPHSLVKHQIVRDYLQRYIQVLMSNVNIEKLTLSIVDGFAGGGEYLSEDGKQFHEGSPLIALSAVAEQQALLNIGRRKPRLVDAKYYFVEKKKCNYDYLCATLDARLPGGRDKAGNVVPIHGRFQDKVQDILADIKGRGGGERSIFLLDQYAYDQVPAESLNRIFAGLRGAEVILTFNVDSLMTFLGDTEQCRKKLSEMGLERYVDWERLRDLKNASPMAWRAAIQRNLAKGLIEVSGARHYTIFYITPLGSTSWTYWLVHLSNSYKARDVMMELHWQLANHFSHNLEPDLFTLGYRANDDAQASKQDWLELDQAHQFDALAGERCKRGLTEKLVPIVYDSPTPRSFGEILESMGSLTPATADMVRQSLDPAIKQGDLEVLSVDGVKRTRGSSLKPGDVLRASAQRALVFGANGLSSYW